MMNNIYWCTMLAMIAVTNTQGASLTISDNGQARYRIVIPANAIPSERYAAEELQRYLEKISGAKLSIVTDSEKMGDSEILLGDNAHTRKIGAKIDWAKLGADGFTLLTHKNQLVIAGGKPRGTLYGVYALLEEKLGVRWFVPDCEVVPTLERLTLPTLNETQVPPLENREVYWTELLRNADFAARQRINGASFPLTEKHGGRAVVYYPFVHSFDELIPLALYDAHPEYFPLINGKRVNGYVQRCLSNPDVIKMAIERVRQWIKEHPDANIISVSQNDTGNWCQCDKCKPLDDAEGSPSASMIKFVNTVAEAIEKDHPNIRIDTLAYQYTRKPPKTLRPRRNVIVRLCSIECCFAHPLETCTSDANKRFCDDIIAWQPIAPLLYIWDYTTNFAHYEQPYPNFGALQANVQFFVKHNVHGLFEQGNYQSFNGEMAPLRAYVLAKLLWNPDADVKRHADEFLRGYFGKAAGDILAYTDLLQQQVSQKPIHAHINDAPTSAYLNDEFLAAAAKLFDDAEQHADNDTVRLRVQTARLPLWCVLIESDRVKGDARTALLKNFLAVARKANVTQFNEGVSLNDWAKRMGVE